MEQQRKSQMLQQMKKNVKQMEQGVTMMTRGLRVCTAAKIAVPAEVTTAISGMQGAIAKIKSAKDSEEIEDIDFSDFASVGDDVRELVDGCHRLQEIPRITKQATRDIQRQESDLRRMTSQATRAKLDLADQLGSVQQLIASVKSTLAEVANVRDAAAAEDAMDKLQDLQDSFENIREQMDAIRSVLNVKQGLRDATTQIRNAERRIAVLKRQRKDVTEVTALLAEAKSQVKEIEALAKQKPIDVDALSESFGKLEDIGSRADDLFAELEGKTTASGSSLNPTPAQNLKLDVFDQFREQPATGSSQSSSDIESLLGL